MFGVESISVAKSLLGGAGWRVNDYLAEKWPVFKSPPVRLILVGGQKEKNFRGKTLTTKQSFPLTFFRTSQRLAVTRNLKCKISEVLLLKPLLNHF